MCVRASVSTAVPSTSMRHPTAVFAAHTTTSQRCAVQARIFVHEGVTKVRLTGGEPTVRRDLVDVCARLAALPGLQTLAMTTNGLALRRSLHALRAAGLSALNISLDTLRPERFAEMTRHRGQERVLAAIHEAVALGFAVKVNVVVMRGDNEDELLDFVALTRDAPLNVRFIEYMPFDDNAWSRRKMVRDATYLGALRVRMRAERRLHQRCVRAVHIQGDGGRDRSGRGAAESRAGSAWRGGKELQAAGLQGVCGLHHEHDGALLRGVQPRAPHGGRQPQGVPVRRKRGEPAGRDARGRHGRAAAAPHPGRRFAQALRARRRGRAGGDSQSGHDPDWRLSASAATRARRSFCILRAA